MLLLGLPGPVDRTKLLGMASKIGVGDSTRFLAKQKGLMTRLVAPGGFTGESFLTRCAPTVGEPGMNVAGLHVYTFIQLAQTEAWRQDWLRRLAAWPAGRIELYPSAHPALPAAARGQRAAPDEPPRPHDRRPPRDQSRLRGAAARRQPLPGPAAGHHPVVTRAVSDRDFTDLAQHVFASQRNVRFREGSTPSRASRSSRRCVSSTPGCRRTRSPSPSRSRSAPW